MKKIISTAIILLGISIAVQAQPRALGLRLGWCGEATYQHSINRDFIEADLGWNLGSYQATGIYNFIIACPNWTDGEWNIYAGPGITLGGGPGYGFVGGIVGDVGIEYTFNIPLQLALDIRPQFDYISKNPKLFGSHLGYSCIPCLSVRYRF